MIELPGVRTFELGEFYAVTSCASGAAYALNVIFQK